MAHAPLAPRPRKRLGQHFLTDQNIVRKILALVSIRPEETVLEIGPGRGALTRRLCQAARAVIAVELDPQLFTYLSETLKDCSNLDLRLGDALTYPYETLPPDTVVVANLPYNISTPLLFRLLEARERISRMILMLQKEVAERLVAKPGTAQYGVLSVIAQFFADIHLAFLVSPNCFTPRPEVGSAVVRLSLPKQHPIPVQDTAAFVRLVRAAFAHRRKTLANSLRDEGLSADEIARVLANSGIHPARRAETLSLAEFATLADALSSY